MFSSSLGFGLDAKTDINKKKYDEGFARLQSMFPELSCPSLTSIPKPSRTSRKKSKVPKTEDEDDLSFNLPSSSLNSRISSQVIRKPIDLSSSKLAALEEPAGSVAPTPVLGKRKLKAIKKKIRESTKGPQWYDMKAPEITDERKNDLEALSLRSALDTKRFYKRNSLPVKPKYFQVGKIVGTSADFYHSRVTKKQQKRTIAEEFMAEAGE